jgi:hypothetical protein
MSKEKLLTIGTLAALCVMAAFSMHAKAAGEEGMVYDVVTRGPDGTKNETGRPQATGQQPMHAGSTPARTDYAFS